MRKAVLTAIVLVIAAFFAFYGVNRKEKKLGLDLFLPENTLLFMQQKELGHIAEKMEAQSALEKLRRVDTVHVARELGVPAVYLAEIREWSSLLLSSEFEDLFAEYLSRDFSIGLLYSDDLRFSEDAFLKNTLLFCDTRHKGRMSRFFTRYFNRDIELSSSNYGSYVVYRINYRHLREAYAVILGGKTLIAFDQRTLHHALDRFDDKARNLTNNVNYEQVRDRRYGAQFFLFADVATIRNKLTESITEIGYTDSLLLSFLRHLQGVDAMAYSVQGKGLLVGGHGAIFFNSFAARGSLRPPSTPPEVDSDSGIVPDDTLLYYWTNTFDPASMWDVYADDVGERQGNIADHKMIVEKLAGVSLDDLFSIFGSRLHVIVRRHRDVDPVPFPNFSVLLETRDRTKAKTLLDNFFTRNMIPRGKESFAGEQYFYWGEMRQKGLQPVFGFTDEGLLISSSVAMHRAVIEARAGKKDLEETEDYALLAKSFAQESNSLYFLQFDGLLGIVEKLVNWWGALTAIQGEDEARNARKIIDDVIQPLLETMRMFNAMSVRTSFRNNVLNIEAKTRIHGENGKTD